MKDLTKSMLIAYMFDNFTTIMLILSSLFIYSYATQERYGMMTFFIICVLFLIHSKWNCFQIYKITAETEYLKGINDEMDNQQKRYLDIFK